LAGAVFEFVAAVPLDAEGLVPHPEADVIDPRLLPALQPIVVVISAAAAVPAHAEAVQEERRAVVQTERTHPHRVDPGQPVPLEVSEKFRGKTARGLYGDVIEEIDWSVGQILDALKRSGLEQSTWVIFTSDNGPWLCYGNHAGSAKPLREGKGTNWEGGTREPCIMRWPGHIPAGADTWDMLMTIDLFPAIQMTGIGAFTTARGA
jgi:arylsulfatase A-like enzyme